MIQNAESQNNSKENSRPVLSVKCFYCNSERIWKNGKRDKKHKLVQRFICRDCGYRFSEPIKQPKIKNNIASQVFKRFSSNNDLPHNISSRLNPSLKESFNDHSFSWSKDVAPHICTVIGQNLNGFRDYNSTDRVCASEKSAKNLVAAKQITEQIAAGEINQRKSLVINYIRHLLKQGYAESTIKGRVSIIETMIKRGADLNDIESIKLFIAKQENWSQGRKRNAVHAYSNYLDMIGESWNPPSYQIIEKPIWLPQETEIDQLIAGCSRKMGTFLQLLKETGMRLGEAYNLQWIDIDFETKLVNVTPEKGSNPRTLRLSDKLMSMINRLGKENKFIFMTTLLKHFRSGYEKQRKRISANLNNSRIQRITFKTLRHFKGTMEYHKTKDILHVKYVLGHKNIKNTLVYTHLIQFTEKDEFISKIAKTDEEFAELIELGFDYVGPTPSGNSAFRKRK